MSPLDHDTPQALFGEAVESERSLRRAYARLVRAHSPEEEPEVFEHIRRLYEQARDRLQASTIPGSGVPGSGVPAAQGPALASPTASPLPVGSPWQGLSADGMAHQLVAGGVDELGARLGSLQEYLRHSGGRAEVRLLLACVEAAAPEQLGEVFLDLLKHRASQAEVKNLLRTGVLLRTELALGDFVERALPLLDGDAHRRLVLTRAMRGASLHCRPPRVVELFRLATPELWIELPMVRAQLVTQVLELAPFDLESSELDALLDEVESASFGGEQGVDELVQHIFLARAWQRARAEGTVPDVVLDALYWARGASAREVVGLLRDVAEEVEDLPGLVAGLCEREPELVAGLHELEEQLVRWRRWLARPYTADRLSPEVHRWMLACRGGAVMGKARASQRQVVERASLVLLTFGLAGLALGGLVGLALGLGAEVTRGASPDVVARMDWLWFAPPWVLGFLAGIGAWVRWSGDRPHLWSFDLWKEVELARASSVGRQLELAAWGRSEETARRQVRLETLRRQSGAAPLVAGALLALVLSPLCLVAIHELDAKELAAELVMALFMGTFLAVPLVLVVAHNAFQEEAAAAAAALREHGETSPVDAVGAVAREHGLFATHALDALGGLLRSALRAGIEPALASLMEDRSLLISTLSRAHLRTLQAEDRYSMARPVAEEASP